jgi:hypothetical protein
VAAVEQNTLKRRGIGLVASDPDRIAPGFALFVPHPVENRAVYLIVLQGRIVHTWKMPYPPGLSGYLTERGTLFYNGRTPGRAFSAASLSKVASSWKRTGTGKCFENYAIRITIIMASCCAMEMCRCIAWDRCPKHGLSGAQAPAGRRCFGRCLHRVFPEPGRRHRAVIAGRLSLGCWRPSFPRNPGRFDRLGSSTA